MQRTNLSSFFSALLCRGLFALAALFSAAPFLTAQIEHKKEWEAVRTIAVAAPPPTRLEGRRREFAGRDSAPALATLATEFFALIDPDYRPEDPAQQALYVEAFAHHQAQRHREALDTYRKFIFARLRHPPAGFKIKSLDPTKRTFIEFFNEPERLMRGSFTLCAFDRPMPAAIELGGVDSILNYYRAKKHNAHMVNLDLRNQPPGEMNWVYQPDGYWGPTVHLPTGPSFVASSYNKDMVFSPLLAAYAETRDARFLQRWVGYVDDYLLNYRRDLAEAGLRYEVEWGGAGGPNFGHLAYLVTTVPETDRDLPATTFVRYLKNKWLCDLPLHIRGTRSAGPNRIMHMYGFLLLESYLNFPELKCAGYLLQERRRALEWYARSCVNADGTGIDYAPNYNKNFIDWPGRDYAILRGLKSPPAWATPEWRREIAEHQLDMARYLIRDFAPSGGKPGFKNVDLDLRDEHFGPKSFLRASLPEALTDPENARVAAMLTNPGSTPEPGFRSESYPYGGYAFFRENWQPDAQFAYFHSYRPGSSGAWRFNHNLLLYAFGQKMLNFYTEESPLHVDDCGQIYAGVYPAAPERYRHNPDILHYGKYQSRMAWIEPLKNRWHTSSYYDLAEGDIGVPYMETYLDRPPVFIDDVRHGRQVMFVREAGVWLVTDRIRSGRPHDYHLRWGFFPDRPIPEGWHAKADEDSVSGPSKDARKAPGYARHQIVIDPARHTIKTQHPQRPNLSVYHSATANLTLTLGEIAQNNDKFGNAYIAGPKFRADRATVVATLLFPRKTAAVELARFHPVKGDALAGFDADTPSGHTVHYRAALEPAALTAGPVAGTASVLLATRASDGGLGGVALDCRALSIDGKVQKPPAADFEFRVAPGGKVEFTPIYRPMDLVKILPAADHFVDELEVVLRHAESDVDIRYTLDGSDPTLKSPIYKNPFKIERTTWLKARAFRRGVTQIPPTQDGTLMSARQSALFTKAEPWAPPPAPSGRRQPGLNFAYSEDDWTISMLKMPLLKPVLTGVARDLADVSARRKNGSSYAFHYDGFIEIPRDGVYTIHAPKEMGNYTVDTGSDIRLFLNEREWYPATRRHNFGGWTVPLKKGSYPLRFIFVDQRPGDLQASKGANNNLGDWLWKGAAPSIEISGPGVQRQPIPAAWLWSLPGRGISFAGTEGEAQ